VLSRLKPHAIKTAGVGSRDTLPDRVQNPIGCYRIRRTAPYWVAREGPVFAP
jgi:hypothetical protein